MLPNSPRRILLKVSGEALMGEAGFGLDTKVMGRVASAVAGAAGSGLEIAVVVGGGNIFRGVAGAARGMDRVTADYVGMLATVMNGLALAGAIAAAGGRARAMSAIPMDRICETYTRHGALDRLAAGEVVICAGGTGSPFFTTDTTAALRAAELECEALVKATQVDGIYDADPKTNPGAKRFDRLTFAEALKLDLKVMDIAAFALARDSAIPIIVFDISEIAALDEILAGTGRATLVSG